MSKVALVTGASRGIGKAISLKLIEKGYQVIGIARHFEWRDPNLIPILLDLSLLDKLPFELKKIEKEISRLDTLVCNAGIGKFGKLEQFSYQQIRHLLDLNFLSQVYVIKTFLPLMKRQKQGNIIAIGSEAALAGKKEGSLYCASKSALRSFLQALREECAGDNIRVTLINPGMVKTTFFQDLPFSPGEQSDEYLTEEDIADTLSFILSARLGAVFEEININPQKKRIIRKRNFQNKIK